MRGLALALQFLTRLPIPVRGEVTGAEIGRSARWYAVAGALIGLLIAAVDAVLGLICPPLVRAVLDTAVVVFLTGGLHQDGLMDTTDGVGSGKPKERALEIMRDSRVGAMGAIAGALTLLLRTALYASLPGSVRWPALLLAPALGRTAIVWAAARYPSARPGLGSLFADGVGTAELSVAAVSALALAGGLAAAGLAWGVAPAGHILAALALAAGTALVVAAWLARRLGGQTGDTFGALCEATELAALLAFTLGVHA